MLIYLGTLSFYTLHPSFSLLSHSIFSATDNFIEGVPVRFGFVPFLSTRKLM